jgi:hypothetical protein
LFEIVPVIAVAAPDEFVKLPVIAPDEDIVMFTDCALSTAGQPVDVSSDPLYVPGTGN